MPLVRRQAQLKEFIAAHIAKGEGAPSVEEMRVALGLKSKASAHIALTNLERRGHIRRTRHSSARNGWAMKRAIEIVHERHACPHCGRDADA
ncbi:MAG: hypothetical protein HY243_15595 [Proteobacteria bacterium]|nr:hypothetical protein [Pseudomonadota bacterium]